MSERKCVVVGCERREDEEADYCREHMMDFAASPEAERVAVAHEEGRHTYGVWATATADYCRRVSLESQRDRETREGEQR